MFQCSSSIAPHPIRASKASTGRLWGCWGGALAVSHRHPLHPRLGTVLYLSPLGSPVPFSRALQPLMLCPLTPGQHSFRGTCRCHPSDLIQRSFISTVLRSWASIAAILMSRLLECPSISHFSKSTSLESTLTSPLIHSTRELGTRL